jgi:hypothetical protein
VDRRTARRNLKSGLWMAGAALAAFAAAWVIASAYIPV